MQGSQERLGVAWKEYLTVLVCVIGISAISGCSTTSAITDTSCSSFEPIHASTKDTNYTKRQVIQHNAAYDAICGPAPLK